MEHATSSAGEAFVKSDAYHDLKSTHRLPTGDIPVGSFYGGTKQLTAEDTSAGALVTPMRMPGISAPADRPLRLRDLLPSRSTTEGVVERVREVGYTQAAESVPAGELKPESDLTFELRRYPVITVAHWVRAPRQLLADAAGLRTHVDGRLTFGVRDAEEVEILFGDGSEDHLHGILSDPDRQQFTATDGMTPLDAIRRGITLTSLAHLPASGVAVHPTDRETIDTNKGDDNHYVLQSASANGSQPSYWRLPIVESVILDPGRAIVGAFAFAAEVHDRETASVRISESHGDFFVRNMIVLLGESRLSVSTSRPEAIVDISLNGAANGNGGNGGG